MEWAASANSHCVFSYRFTKNQPEEKGQDSANIENKQVKYHALLLCPLVATMETAGVMWAAEMETTMRALELAASTNTTYVFLSDPRRDRTEPRTTPQHPLRDGINETAGKQPRGFDAPKATAAIPPPSTRPRRRRQEEQEQSFQCIMYIYIYSLTFIEHSSTKLSDTNIQIL
jgi:hypothetical protein